MAVENISCVHTYSSTGTFVTVTFAYEIEEVRNNIIITAKSKTMGPIQNHSLPSSLWCNIASRLTTLDVDGTILVPTMEIAENTTIALDERIVIKKQGASRLLPITLTYRPDAEGAVPQEKTRKNYTVEEYNAYLNIYGSNGEKALARAGLYDESGKLVNFIPYYYDANGNRNELGVP